jgi:hypothetical protein
MSEERISQPVAGIATPHDRPSDAGRYERLEDARGGGRRPPRRPPPERDRPARRPASENEATDDARAPGPADGVRGTRLDVIA